MALPRHLGVAVVVGEIEDMVTCPRRQGILPGECCEVLEVSAPVAVGGVVGVLEGKVDDSCARLQARGPTRVELVEQRCTLRVVKGRRHGHNLWGTAVPGLTRPGEGAGGGCGVVGAA